MPPFPLAPPTGDVVLALRARMELGALAVANFPPAAQRILWNTRSAAAPQQGTPYLREGFTTSPSQLNGPSAGGGLRLNGLYILTYAANGGAGVNVLTPIDELVRLYFSAGTVVRTAGGIPVHVVGDGGPWLDGPRNINGWPVITANIPWYVLARNATIP